MTQSASSRNVLIVVVGIGVSGVAVTFVTWILVRIGLIPVGQLAQISAEAQKGGASSGAETQLFALLLAAGWYSEWLIGPVVAAGVGLLVGWLGITKQWLCAAIAVLPLGIVMGGFSPGRPWRGLLIMAVVSGATGYLAGLRRRLLKE
jgi:hypothetical protein